MRRRKVLQTIQNIDAFPKTSEECIELSTTGGTISLASFVTMGILLVWECSYYLETKFIYKFHPDVDFLEKLKINLDITVAMPCPNVGADILDVTAQHMMTHKQLQYEDTWFELDSEQLIHFQGVQRVNSYLRNEFHSVQDILWKSGYIDIFGDMPVRRIAPDRPKDACRIRGSVTLNKVAGNFHITAGKSIHLPIGHAHLSMFLEERDHNFSHRINKLSFGDPAPGIIHPLEGDEEISDKHMMMYQYFITVVPTKINTYRQFGNSFQYSVSQQGREISHTKGSHGNPGIYFKYDVSALQVEVVEEHEPFLQFLTRLIGIIGGIFACSGMLHNFVGILMNVVFCRYFNKPKLALYDTASSSDVKNAAESPFISNLAGSSSPTIPPTSPVLPSSSTSVSSNNYQMIPPSPGVSQSFPFNPDSVESSGTSMFTPSLVVPDDTNDKQAS